MVESDLAQQFELEAGGVAVARGRMVRPRPGGTPALGAQSLLAEGLVDVLQLAIGPVMDPTGRRLFERLEDLRRLELVSAVPTPAGTVWVTYRLGGS